MLSCLYSTNGAESTPLALWFLVPFFCFVQESTIHLRRSRSPTEQSGSRRSSAVAILETLANEPAPAKVAHLTYQIVSTIIPLFLSEVVGMH